MNRSPLTEAGSCHNSVTHEMVETGRDMVKNSEIKSQKMYPICIPQVG